MSSSEKESEYSDFEETEGVEIVEQYSEDTTTTLMNKPGTKSKVWQYFGFEVGEKGRVKDGNTPVCRIGSCSAHVKTKHSSTTNLYSHLKQHHPTEYELVRPKKDKHTNATASGSRTITEAFKLATKLSSTSHEHKTITKGIAYHLAKDMRPLSTVELPG